jgi:hypothetical protein
MKKLELVHTDNYMLLVSDEEIKEGEIYNYGKSLFLVEKILHKSGPFRHLSPKMEIQGKFLPDMKIGKFDSMTPLKKIIAYQPKGNAPELDLPLFPEIVVEDEVEKLFIEKSNIPYFPSDLKETCNWWFKEGYKSATKVYSEEDLRTFCKFYVTNQINSIWDAMELYIQSLKQPTPKWFVAETKYDSLMDENSWWEDNLIVKLKTTTIDSKIYLVGTYEYE